jgi:hypothetical protein
MYSSLRKQDVGSVQQEPIVWFSNAPSASHDPSAARHLLPPKSACRAIRPARSPLTRRSARSPLTRRSARSPLTRRSARSPLTRCSARSPSRPKLAPSLAESRCSRRHQQRPGICPEQQKPTTVPRPIDKNKLIFLPNYHL